jgi:hypothetical protein
MVAPAKIIALRRLLEEKHGPAAIWGGGCLQTGLEVLDRLRLPEGSLTEIVCEPRRPGGALLLASLLDAATGHRVALIDGKDAFDPATISPRARPLWVRCPDALQAARAADLVARDGNVSLTILLLTLNPARELRRLHANVWHRLQMLVEKNGTALLAFTPFAHLGAARMRLSVSGHFPLGGVEVFRPRLEPRLALAVERRRTTLETHGGGDDVLRRFASA